MVGNYNVRECSNPLGRVSVCALVRLCQVFEDGMNKNNIVRASGLHYPTVNRITDGMVSLDLLVKVKKRGLNNCNILRLTEKGRNFMAAIYSAGLDSMLIEDVEIVC